MDTGFRITATRPLPDPTGGPWLSADEVQRNALAAIADRFAIVARYRIRSSTRRSVTPPESPAPHRTLCAIRRFLNV